MQSEHQFQELQASQTQDETFLQPIFKVPGWSASHRESASLGQFLAAHVQQQADASMHCQHQNQENSRSPQPQPPGEDDDTLNPFSSERFLSHSSKPVVGTCLNRLDHEGQLSLAQHLPNPQTRFGIKLRAIDGELLQIKARLSLLTTLTHKTREVRQSICLLESRSQTLIYKRERLFRQLCFGLGQDDKKAHQKMAQRLLMLHEALLDQGFYFLEGVKDDLKKLLQVLSKKPWFQKITRPIQVRLQIREITSRMAMVESGLGKQMAQPEASTETVSALVVEYDRLSMQLAALRPMPAAT
ncbi:MAG: hypothetical protein VKK59_00720 [Vampirovibrionales bacterium]|nr:hypothetical protein [Vampirovibrionales bacterium]